MSIQNNQTNEVRNSPVLDRPKVGNHLLIMAWAIEIIAAGVGLFLALSRLDASVSLYNNFVGALPFFAVMLMELTKIPLATVVYHTASKRLRLCFSVALLLSMGITFETFYIGFDQYQSQITKILRSDIKQIEEVKSKIETESNKLIDKKAASEKVEEGRRSYEQSRRAIDEKHKPEQEQIKKQKRDIYKQYEGSKKAIQTNIDSLNKDIKEVQKEINDEKEKSKLQNDLNITNWREVLSQEKRDIEKKIVDKGTEKDKVNKITQKEIKEIRNAFDKQLEECTFRCPKESERDKRIEIQHQNRDKKLLSIDDAIRSLNKRKNETIEKELSGGVRTLETNKGFISNLEKRLDSLRNNRRKAQQKLEITSSEISRSDKQIIKELDEKVQKITDDRSRALDQAQLIFSNIKSTINQREKESVGVEKNKISLQTDLSNACLELNDKVHDNQVYRLAMQLHGLDNACDINQAQLSITQLLWFGSLATVTSALGITLAFASLVIKYGSSNKPPSYSTKFYKSLRRLLIIIRRRRNKPIIKEVEKIVEKEVELIKEIPVEKVVFRDVPIEIVKKEIVHVPLYTSDPDLLKKPE